MDSADHWLYRAFNDSGALLYVGITSYGMQRLRAHGKNAEWWPQVASLTVAHFASRAEAVEAETVAIRSEGPRYNVVHSRRGPEYKPAPVPGAYPPLALVPDDGTPDESGRPRWHDSHIDRWAQRAHPDMVDEWVVSNVEARGHSYTVTFDHPCDAAGGFSSSGFAGVPADEVADVALEQHKADVRVFLGVPQPLVR